MFGNLVKRLVTVPAAVACDPPKHPLLNCNTILWFLHWEKFRFGDWWLCIWREVNFSCPAPSSCIPQESPFEHIKKPGCLLHFLFHSFQNGLVHHSLCLWLYEALFVECQACFWLQLTAQHHLSWILVQLLFHCFFWFLKKKCSFFWIMTVSFGCAQGGSPHANPNQKANCIWWTVFGTRKSIVLKLVEWMNPMKVFLKTKRAAALGSQCLVFHAAQLTCKQCDITTPQHEEGWLSCCSPVDQVDGCKIRAKRCNHSHFFLILIIVFDWFNQKVIATYHIEKMLKPVNWNKNCFWLCKSHCWSKSVDASVDCQVNFAKGNDLSHRVPPSRTMKRCLDRVVVCKLKIWLFCIIFLIFFVQNSTMQCWTGWLKHDFQFSLLAIVSQHF